MFVWASQLFDCWLKVNITKRLKEDTVEGEMGAANLVI